MIYIITYEQLRFFTILCMLYTYIHPIHHNTSCVQIFKLDILYECPDGTLAVAPSRHIIEQLHDIINMTPDPSEYPVGILTSDHRDTWTKNREKLMRGECYKHFFL